jgi:hypothetical protein
VDNSPWSKLPHTPPDGPTSFWSDAVCAYGGEWLISQRTKPSRSAVLPWLGAGNSCKCFFMRHAVL